MAGRAAASVAVLLASVAPAAARPVPERSGFTIGFDAGFGEMSPECADGCTGPFDHSAAVSLHAGAMVRPAMALLYDGWLLVHLSDSAFGDVLVLHSLHTAALQGWIRPRLWLRGGVGAAHLRIDYGELGARNDVVPALAFAAGYEALARGPLAVDLALRVGAGFFDLDEAQEEAVYSASLSAGLSWY